MTSLLEILRRGMYRVPIFCRIAIGNTAIIIFGAIFGTLITRHLTNQANANWLIGIFALIGVLVSLATNFMILRAALQPLRQLSQLADRLRQGNNAPPSAAWLSNPDPDTLELARTLKALIIQLDERNRELRAVSERALTTQEEERKEIARSLHDDSGQSLSMLIITLDRIAEQIPEHLSSVRHSIEEARQLASQTLSELRKIIFGLRPTILDDLGLVPAIRWYAQTTLKESGIRFHFSAPPSPPELITIINTTLFRIAQEAIHNIIRHANAKNVTIRLVFTEKKVDLEIQDDGQGFDLQRFAEQAIQLQQMGLLGIRERAELLSGRFEISSAPGQGTRLHISLPVFGC